MKTVLTRRFITAVLVFLLGLLTVTLVSANGHSSSSSVYDFGSGDPVAGASASLNRGPNGISMQFNTNGLEPGSAYTNWWVVFNHPENCTGGTPDLSLCGPDDFANGDVGGSVLWATGHVIGGSGTATFSAHLTAGSPSGQVLFGPGLLNPDGAEIHIVARTHGQALTGQALVSQLKTVGGGCDVNVCEDTQFAVFVP